MFTSSLSAPVFFLVIFRTLTDDSVEGKEDMTEKTNITENAFADAPVEVEEFLDAAVNGIDYKFGKGYAKEHPELVGAYIQSCFTFIQTRQIHHAINELSLNINSCK